MANAKRDENDVATALGVSSVDGQTTLLLTVDPVTDYLLVEVSSDSLTPTPATQDKIDQNDQKTKYGVSSVDGVTLIPIRTDSNGVLLVE